MSDRPQAVRTGTRPDGAPGADRAPDGDPAAPGGPAAGSQAVGASAAGAGTAPVGAPPTGSVPLAKPATGQAPVQAPSQSPVQSPVQAPTGPAVPPAGAPQGGSSGTTQSITPAAAAAAPPPAGARGQQAGGQQAGGKAPKRGPRGPRRARLQLRHIDTWSALKISLVLSIAMFFIWMVAVGILYGVLSGVGVFDTLNDLFGQLGTASGGEGGGDVITPGVVFGGAAVIGAINIVLMTALCTVAAFIYNLCADLVGGVEVTLAERE